MPQVAVETFHALTITTLILIFFFFSFVYYFVTPFWSVLLKVGVKTNLTSFFLLKTTKNIIAKLLPGDKLLKSQRSNTFFL